MTYNMKNIAINDCELDDVFAMQDEIAGAIIEALKVKLALVMAGAVQPNAIKAVNTDAYDAYLKGRELSNRGGQENMGAAVRHFERALQLVENFALAHAQLAIATIFYGVSRKARKSALKHLDRAQELEPDLAEAHVGRALLAHHANDFRSTIEHLRKALASESDLITRNLCLHGTHEFSKITIH